MRFCSEHEWLINLNKIAMSLCSGHWKFYNYPLILRFYKLKSMHGVHNLLCVLLFLLFDFSGNSLDRYLQRMFLANMKICFETYNKNKIEQIYIGFNLSLYIYSINFLE